ncbi:hypothetical protein B0H19DRAFT_1241007 [Mycena capillaripes]|nr:hypothetical protein B0H19DRAFT_1241007 [Mycena capillaripes]
MRVDIFNARERDVVRETFIMSYTKRVHEFGSVLGVLGELSWRCGGVGILAIRGGVRRSGARLRIRSAPSVSKRLKPTTALRAPRSGRSSPPYTACPGGRSREDEERGVGGRPEVLLVLRYTDANLIAPLPRSSHSRCRESEAERKKINAGSRTPPIHGSKYLPTEGSVACEARWNATYSLSVFPGWADGRTRIGLGSAWSHICAGTVEAREAEAGT